MIASPAFLGLLRAAMHGQIKELVKLEIDKDATSKGILSGLTGQEAVVVSAGAFLNPGESIIPQRVKSTG